MSRTSIIVLSVIACAFGLLSLLGPEDYRREAYAVNAVTAIAAAISASIDLKRRGYGWGWAMLAAYLAPLVGTILYIVFSGQRGYEQPARSEARAG